MNKLLGHHYTPQANNSPLSKGYNYQPYNQPGTKPTLQNNQSYAFGRLPADDALDRFQKEQYVNKSNLANSYHNSPVTEPYSPKQNASHYSSPYPNNNNSNLYSSQVNAQNDSMRNSGQLNQSHMNHTHMDQVRETYPNQVEVQKPSNNIFQETRPQALGMSNSSVTLRQNPLTLKSWDQTNKYETNATDNLNKLSFDIMKTQKPLEQRIEESMKKRPYNILTNQGSGSSSSSAYHGMPYGYALKALLKNQEDAKIQKAMESKGAEYSSPLQTSKKFDTYRSVDYKDALRNQYKGPGEAGKTNYYGETEFRYANKTQMQDPLSPEQMYGIRALKNLSGMKLY
jgi:hypothetical protein